MKRCSIVLLVALGGLFINESVKAATILYCTSSPGSWVGYNGQTVTLTPSTATFNVGYNADSSVVLNASYLDRGWTHLYGLTLMAPNNTLPTVGFYPNAISSPFSGTHPRLSFTSPARGNSSSTGYFNVLQADYGSNGTINSFAVDFVQYDEGVTANWVSGSFRYNSDIPIPEPATLLLMGIGGFAIRKCVWRRKLV